MTNHRCPDCNTLLSSHPGQCACGWQHPSPHPPEYRCIYTHANQRCPNRGWISTNTRPPWQWYCRAHMPWIDDIQKQHALQQALLATDKKQHLPNAHTMDKT